MEALILLRLSLLLFTQVFFYSFLLARARKLLMFDEREVNDGLKSRGNKFRCSQRNSERNEKRPG